MRITEGQLRSFIRESLLTEIEDEALAVAPDDRYKNLKMDPETKARVSAAATAAVEGTIDFTKSLGELALDTIVYFRTGKFLLDAISLMTPVAHAPKDEKDVQAVIGAAKLHDFLDKFGTAGFEPADLINAAVYMLERNWKMAALCSVAAIPVVGTVISKSRAGKLAVNMKVLDAEIAQLKTSLKNTGDPGADLVIGEVGKIQDSIKAGKTDLSDFAPTRERRDVAESVANKRETLESAAEELDQILARDNWITGGTERAGLNWIKNPMVRSKLYTLSNRPIKGVYDTVAQLRPGRKPVGLWIARGDDWITHLSAGYVDPRLMDATHVYEVNIKSASSDLQKSGGILILKNEAEVAEFTRRYGMTTAGNEPAINWPEVAKRYDGIALLDDASYAQTGWRWGWDLESICVWRSTAIQSMTTFAVKQ